METNKIFPNGFTSWQETHFEVVSYLVRTVDISNSMSYLANEEGGTGRLYELAKELTDKFELDNINRDWDGEYFDTIEEFLHKEENNHGK